MLPFLLIVGFAMTTLGVALLVIGEVPFVAGKRIPAVRSRLIGAVLVGFLPLALAAGQLSRVIFGDDAVEGPVMVAMVFTVACVVIGIILFRVMIPKVATREQAPVAAKKKKNPFDEQASNADAGAPWPPEPAARKPSRKPSKPPADDNPFDFS
jgi:hypothetical protein